MSPEIKTEIEVIAPECIKVCADNGYERRCSFVTSHHLAEAKAASLGRLLFTPSNANALD